jgi:tRNA1(Val) A37 N6-methylase TrmN6
MKLLENERIDEVNDSLSLIQKIDGLTFGTDALLLAGYIGRGYKTGAEFGGGTGIISMLLRARGKVDFTYCVEVQEEFSELIARNIEYNSLSGIECVRADIREWRAPMECELVYTNPPYMKTTSGRACTLDGKNIARHEVCGDILDFILAAKRTLKYGGTLTVVYRPDRMIDLTSAMREGGIEPKRMTFVSADTESAPSIMLVEGKRGGKCGLRLTRPFYIYKDKSHGEYSEDMEYVLKHGYFPDDYYIK